MGVKGIHVQMDRMFLYGENKQRYENPSPDDVTHGKTHGVTTSRPCPNGVLGSSSNAATRLTLSD
jgi:hypothetical protein